MREVDDRVRRGARPSDAELEHKAHIKRARVQALNESRNEAHREAERSAHDLHRAALDELDESHYQISACGKLRYAVPYAFGYRTNCKRRWVGRELADVFAEELGGEGHDREYWLNEVRCGRILIRGAVVTQLPLVLSDPDWVVHLAHRHEGAVLNIPIGIVYEDEHLLVVDKPASVPAHPCGRYRKNSLSFLLHLQRKQKDPCADVAVKSSTTELRGVHRLDRLTSGILILAKDAETAKQLTQQIVDGLVRKKYLARVAGRFGGVEQAQVECTLPLNYDARSCRAHVDTVQGKPARTTFVVRRYSAERDYSIVECTPFTGRTHQIRVHLQALGHPIINDPLYADAATHAKYACENAQLGPGGAEPEQSEPLCSEAVLQEGKTLGCLVCPAMQQAVAERVNSKHQFHIDLHALEYILQDRRAFRTEEPTWSLDTNKRK
ncbi:RNA pseudouridylate synthase domain-containing protein 2 [Porphyridium purpureum]|uniref:Pseudouridine synthase n=1 Tax=Porphyridium purpureum TaxID=35688 RepID=A0A5J4Z1L7_PORPP|nr:RNA pseudouridylate synthase domain-containing protein 2 [Porphyridium purpureum]|eukprot:POR0967..scf208_2